MRLTIDISNETYEGLKNFAARCGGSISVAISTLVASSGSATFSLTVPMVEPCLPADDADPFVSEQVLSNMNRILGWTPSDEAHLQETLTAGSSAQPVFADGAHDRVVGESRYPTAEELNRLLAESS